MSQGNEKEFLNENGITVTNARFVLPSETFAMNGITSVKSGFDKPSKTLPGLLIIIGILMLIGGSDTLAAGIIVTLIGATWFALSKTTFHVVLNTASGETKALSSKDESWVSKIVAALNESIIHRG